MHNFTKSQEPAIQNYTHLCCLILTTFISHKIWFLLWSYTYKWDLYQPSRVGTCPFQEFSNKLRSIAEIWDISADKFSVTEALNRTLLWKQLARSCIPCNKWWQSFHIYNTLDFRVYTAVCRKKMHYLLKVAFVPDSSFITEAERQG